MTCINQSFSSKYQTFALSLGIASFSVLCFGWYHGISHEDGRPLLSLLLGFSVWFSIGIGMLMLTMLFYIFGAGWPIVVRRQLEHALAAFPYLALIISPFIILACFFPEKAGLVWRWMNPDALTVEGGTVASDVIYNNKAAFLNVPFFAIRMILYFTVFCTIASLLRKYSFSLDKEPCLSWVKKGEILSSAGIPLTALSLTFAAFDLYLSISYHWFSTMYGVWFFATSMRAGVAGTILLCSILALPNGPLHTIFNERHRYQLGSIALAFTVFWAYISFSQYFLIYNANIPEETFWFNMRELNADGTKNSWWYVSLLGLIFSYFVVPFFSLLFYKNKIMPLRIAFIALWILAFHIVDLYFNILPQQILADNPMGYEVIPFSITIYDIAAYLGVGSICAWAFLKSLHKSAPIPVQDPYILESIHAHIP